MRKNIFYICRKITHLKLLYSLLFFSILNFAQTGISSAEKNALLQLHQQTNGENWSIQWDLSKEPRFWYGVKVKNGTVVELRLNGNLLQGNLPSLSGLPNLKVLDVSSNRLQGNIGWIAGLNFLESADFSSNEFSGTISSEFSGNTRLKELYLGDNLWKFNNPNSFLESIKQVTRLDISNFDLIEIPSSIQNLTQLEELKLSNNQIKTGFSNLVGLSSLKKLQLANNQLTAIPKEINQLSSLVELDLSSNQIDNSKIPSLVNLQNLEWLSLENNQFSTIPSEILVLKNLVHLNLGRNRISGNLSSLTQLKNLQQVWLHNNLFDGNFPNEIQQMKNLQMLALRSNQLTGNLPQALPEMVDVSNNRFTTANLQDAVSSNPQMVDFRYSPQRYDEATTIKASIGGNALLKQSLPSQDGYTFSWFKNLDTNLQKPSESLSLNNIQEADFVYYTAEAYLEQDLGSKLFELSLFREPIFIENELAVEDIKKQLAIYPNPTKDYLNILSKGISFNESAIYDLSGKLVLKSKSNKIDVRTLPSGAYLLVINTEKGNLVYKWIKL